MKPIAPLLAVLSLAVIVTGCETTRKESCCGSSRCADSRLRQEHRTVGEKVGAGLFWLGQSALFVAANDTAQTEGPPPKLLMRLPRICGDAVKCERDSQAFLLLSQS